MLNKLLPWCIPLLFVLLIGGAIYRNYNLPPFKQGDCVYLEQNLRNPFMVFSVQAIDDKLFHLKLLYTKDLNILMMIALTGDYNFSVNKDYIGQLRKMKCSEVPKND